MLPAECRRGSDYHYWHCYQCRTAPESAMVMLREASAGKDVGESDLMGWVPISQVKAGQFRLYQPVAHFLGKLWGEER